MVQTSTTYNPYADVRKCDILAIFEMLDVGAEISVAATSSDECAISQLSQTYDRVEQMTQKLATLERDYLMLDGTFILPEEDNLEQTGWWSDVISGSDGVFANPPKLTFTWQENHSSVGFTICFDDKAEEYPAQFNVYAYDYTGALINQKTVNNNRIRYFVDMPTENYRKIVFEFISTSKSFRGVRVAEVLFGAVQRFDRDNVVSASLETAFSPDGTSLPSAEFDLVIDNSTKDWNMANPQGIYAYLQKSQPLTVSLGINSEWVNMGKFYFSTASAEDNALTAKITAHDKIFTLDSKIYQGSTLDTLSLNQAVTAVLEYSETGLNFYMTSAIATRMIRGTLPESATCRELLRLITQAGRCACYINRDGVLVFFDPLETHGITDVLNLNNMSAMPKITVGEKINRVELKVGDITYTASNVGVNEPIIVASYDNPLVLDVNGELTATWLMSLRQRRFLYNLQERGNPARDIFDFVTVHDSYGGIRTSTVIRQKLDFDGGLKCEVDAIGVN